MTGEAISVDPVTWGNWERGGTILTLIHRKQVANLLGLHEREVRVTMKKKRYCGLRWGAIVCSIGHQLYFWG